MDTKYQIIILSLTTILLTPTRPEAMEVRQELYRFRMAMTQDVTSATFLICEHRQLKKIVAARSRLPLVYFELASAILSPTAKNILSDLKQYGITDKVPLQLTGYTCPLGSAKLNQHLSRKRADAVAEFLRDHGFVVATVQGQGAKNPITNNSQKFYKNRRVELTTCP
ncbi:MAG: OmpA family protein [Desulforhopalus sp.]